MSSGDNMEEKLLCYNRGCGQYFDPSTNSPESCVYHPGAPVFHDAYKKWACCEKKTTDFTEFLNIKGCTKSYHSNVKPPEPPKPVENSNKEEICSPRQPIKPKEFTVRPDVNLPLKKLSSKVGSSLKSLLENMQNVVLADEIEEKTGVAIDTPCKNSGCRAVYKGEHTNTETCLYHSGYPVFHEGMKFWTCCAKRTTDFNSFLEQVGCTTGNHLWHKPKNLTNKTDCRYDWHQTGNLVVISIYAKCALPDLSYVEANSVKLKLHIVFGKEQSIFDKELVLFNTINVESSIVEYLGSKVEIKLKKADLGSWTNLTFPTKSGVNISSSDNTQDENVNDI